MAIILPSAKALKAEQARRARLKKGPRFTNRIKAEWLPGGRDMRLLEAVTFIDQKGKRWTAPKGAEFNGASIPLALASVVGCPYVGRYRRASVLHDYFCTVRTTPHDIVHQMFYDAMICDGVDTVKAKLMYQAVVSLGPKWDAKGKLLEYEYLEEW